MNAVPYIQKFKRHPVTGEPLELKDLIRCVCVVVSVGGLRCGGWPEVGCS